MARKKIVFVLTSLQKGGAEGKAQKLITALNCCYEVELLVFNNTIDYDLPEDVNIRILGSRMKLLRDSWLQLPLIFLRYFTYIRQPQIQTSFSYGYMPNMLCIWSKLFGWKGKTIINHINNSELELNKASGLKGKIRKALISGYYQKADAIVVPSQGLKEDLLANFGIHADRVWLIYNPLELTTIDVMSSEPVNVDLNEGDAFIFIHVGNHRPQKNHWLLLEAFAEIRNEKTVLWLLGKGTDDESLLSKAKELGISSRIRFYGMVQNPLAFMAKANCLVLSSDYEGLPNVILEALACQLPVISTDCFFGPREILAPETDLRKQTHIVEICQFGILTPVGNTAFLSKAMEMIITRSDKADNYKKLARERAKQFDIDNLLPDYLKLIG